MITHNLSDDGSGQRAIVPRMIDHVTFDVEGVPSPGGSKNAFLNRRTGRVVVTCAGGKKTKTWRAAVAAQARLVFAGRDPIAPPVGLFVEFRMPRPKSHYLADGRVSPSAPYVPIVRPDATKLLRSTEDAMTGIAYVDDAQIHEIRVVRVYVAEGSSGARITVCTVQWDYTANLGRENQASPLKSRR